MTLNVIYDEKRYQEMAAKRDVQLRKKDIVETSIQITCMAVMIISVIIANVTNNKTVLWTCIGLGIASFAILGYSLINEFGKYPNMGDVFNAMDRLYTWNKEYKESLKDNSGFFAKTDNDKWLCRMLVDEYISLEHMLQIHFDYKGIIPEQFETLTLELQENGTVDVRFR